MLPELVHRSPIGERLQKPDEDGTRIHGHDSLGHGLRDAGDDRGARKQRVRADELAPGFLVEVVREARLLARSPFDPELESGLA